MRRVWGDSASPTKPNLCPPPWLLLSARPPSLLPPAGRTQVLSAFHELTQGGAYPNWSLEEVNHEVGLQGGAAGRGSAEGILEAAAGHACSGWATPCPSIHPAQSLQPLCGRAGGWWASAGLHLQRVADG